MDNHLYLPKIKNAHDYFFQLKEFLNNEELANFIDNYYFEIRNNFERHGYFFNDFRCLFTKDGEQGIYIKDNDVVTLRSYLSGGDE